MQKSLKIPANVQIQHNLLNNNLQIQGPLGKNQLQLSNDISIQIDQNFLFINIEKKKKNHF